MTGDSEARREVLAPAKVNVALLVAGRRPDGFHDLLTLMAPLTLADRLTVEVAAGEGVAIACGERAVPNDERNLAARAALAFLDEAGLRRRVTIGLEKVVPVGAGLGGGSSDAAAVLAALNDLLGRPLSADRMWRLALTLGSDVPFFLVGGWALAAGRGEHLTRVRGPAGVPLLVAAPRRGISTPRVYQAVTPGDYAADAGALCGLLARLGRPASEWWPRGVNSLMAPAMRAYTLLARLARRLGELGFAEARLSGSGGAFVAPAVDAARAEAACAALAAEGYWAAVTATA